MCPNCRAFLSKEKVGVELSFAVPRGVPLMRLSSLWGGYLPSFAQRPAKRKPMQLGGGREVCMRRAAAVRGLGEQVCACVASSPRSSFPSGEPPYAHYQGAKATREGPAEEEGAALGDGHCAARGRPKCRCGPVGRA